ncbi:MAG: GntR family transcriptional regulator, transcriptional repressor for pyruvate dehydrogenase complex [Frankiales bacterium]|jgi:GntR family transcriptional repressor for pyruvate dehydrogenase complex|nr:GntR family transcriptional regulator, transcriptional repressor for pyruvate dehydrogenase complex [Frankiales bacterium]
MSRERTHEVVLRRIEEDLGAGRLALGQRLPGERQLAEQLGVSRPSVREAIRVLEAMGIVRTAAGSGAAAGAVIVADPSTALASALRLHLATNHLVIDDIVATRLLIESWSVRTASSAKRHGPFTEAERLLDAMDDRGLTPESFHQLDAEFHVELARLAGNPLVTAVMTALRESIQEYVLAAVPGLPDWTATARKLRREHRGILAAVRAKDGERAAALVTAHITGFYRAAGIGRGPR